MSESIVRKVQPFTIGTRLSVPAGSKCQDFTQTYLQNQSLDNCIQHNLNSLYLSRSQVCTHGPCLVSPIVKQVKCHQEDMAAEDHLNQNVASGSSSVSRSIKKITISGSGDGSEDKVGRLSVTGSTSENNNNNNNISSSSAETHLPRIVGVSCENKPKSHFKVLLRKDGGDEVKPTPGQTGLKLTQDQHIGQVSSAEPPMTERQTEAWAGVASQSDSFTQRNSLFNREVLQAEAWIKGKLQDLKDGCNVQRCPLQDWEEASQTLHRDLKDFENTLIQLNQMGEQLICKTNPSSDLVKKQLSQLRDQWQTLKQMAANQTRALGGAKNLQEFNRKVDKLETWIKQKEEEPSLVDVLGENVDKMQLTRRILDLKQDEQLYRTLHEDINHLALKLEKQGKTDGKNIGSRRKHINKMWIRVQSHLKNCHLNLQLALEVSTFYQQAENTLSAMSDLWKSRSLSKDLDGIGDREIRDLAAQIMMLDVSVSQLSNLHPALASGVSRKHSEVKDGWTHLQRVFRSDRTGPPAPTAAASPFTREDGDPVTPAREPQGHVGTEAQRTMGKEVKEEQNRLKGCVDSVDSGIGQIQELQSVNHAPSPTKDNFVCAHEVMVRHQPKGESRKSRLEPRAEPTSPAAAPPGPPPLHIQLQKFTVSADKTLSWLKDNVSMATQVCSVAGCEGLEAAHRCQRALEQEILTNRARIEVVKREGRSLVRAQHPGSAKIQEFLGQLEVLWEELRRRHQRNQVFLQASKELGFRVVKVLQALGSLEAWLESVELSMKESSLAGDPETMSMAERESRLLEREVAARSPELDALRREVEQLHCHSHTHTRGLPGRMDQVEKKYRRVQSALTQQSSELQDTRMLTEFLERVELEEIQDLGGSRYSLGQPLHADISSAPTLLELQDSGAGDPLMEGMGDPVEELREAVEMLNDTARERGRSQSHDQAVTELLSKHAGVALRVEETLSRCKDLSLDILEKETDMAVQCEPDRCGLEGLRDQQDQLEMDYEVMRAEVQKMQDQASQLQDLCPERMRTLWTRVQTTLEAWVELRTSLTQNQVRLQEFVQLQDFFRRYLGMISWTEDTRSCIFSDTALHFGKDGQRPLAAELDKQIEQKFEEFDELAATGRTLLDSEHHLTQMVRERMEELRSMLGWILVHWRVQKQQWLHKKNRQEAAHDNIYSEAMTSSASAELSPDPDVCLTRHRPSVSDDDDKPTSGFSQDVVDAEAELGHLDDGYEVMKSVGAQGGAEASSGETTKPPILVLKEPGSPSLGGTVNLILSFGGPGDQVQVLEAPPRVEEEEQPSEPVRRVSTYLHVKDNSVAPVYESITLPRLKSRSAGSASPGFSPSSSSSPSTSAPDSQTNINSHGGSSIFSSLKRISKKRKRKRDTRRHTIQKIMGVEEAEPTPRHACDTVTYDTHTWPLKERRRRKNHPKSPVQGAEVEGMAYMKNPLLKDIDTECLGEYTITPYAVSEGPPTGTVRSHCRFLSLGSVLSFDLPKDMTLIPSIQDIITIAPPESKKVSGTDPDPHSQRPTALSSFKQTRPAPMAARKSAQITTDPEKDPPDVDRNLIPPSQDKEEDQRSLEEEQDSAPVSRLPIYINQPPTSCSAHKHGCPSVHTLIRDLNGHRFHKCVRPQTETSAAPPAFNQASHMVVNLKSTVSVSVRQDSVDSGISSTSSIIPSLENPQPRGVVGRVVSLEVGGANCTKTKVPPSDLETEAVCLDRQQFEEEEEELEDIWNQTSNYRQSICSDIMYQPSQDDSAPSDSTGDPVPCSPSPLTPAVLYRNLVTASAPNLLVAEFRLPPSVQSLLGYDKEACPGRRLPPLAAGDRRSWAAFPHREPTKTTVGVNETASDLVKLPDVGDNQRYIYQYREDEEEEEEEVKVGQEVEEHTGSVKESVQSRSLFSVHMGLDAVGQQRPLPQEEAVSTEGRCLHGNLSPELSSMEGTLERKQKLQLGGKKAASRGWSSFHAVLHRHTLCFYQDRKETLRSSACALPLNLTGAECSPALDYNKKPNCFRLRLRDGSEYLLNASSRFMMKKWMMKIQASTGRSEGLTSGVTMETDVTTTSKFCSGCRSLTKCHCSSQHDVVSTIPRLKSPNATEIVVLTRELSHMTRSHMRSLDERSTPTDGDVTPRPGPGPTDWSSSAQDWISSKRRSHSFTSATFQKIRPPLVPPGPRGLEPGSNYCVTLVVGDKSSERNPDLDSGLRSYMSLPRPRNKSVFKKFFGKKDF